MLLPSYFSLVPNLEHQLHAPDDFVELIVAKLGMRLAEIRPSVDVIDHQLDIVAMDVVVEPAGDGMDAVVALLSRIQILPLNRSLKLIRDQEIGCRYVVSTRCKVGESRRHAVHGTAVDVFLEGFTD